MMNAGMPRQVGTTSADGMSHSRLVESGHLAHRAAWELANGPIKDGLFVLHKCDNPRCCNSGHLFLGTQSDNAKDMWAKGRAKPCSGKGGKRGPSSTRTMNGSDVLRIFSLFSAGWTQRMIAEDIGVSDVAISFALRGRTYPEFAEERKGIAHLLGRGTKKRIAASERRMTFAGA